MSSARDWQRVLDSVRAAKDQRAVNRRLWLWRTWFEFRLVLRCGLAAITLVIPPLCVVATVVWLVSR